MTDETSDEKAPAGPVYKASDEKAPAGPVYKASDRFNPDKIFSELGNFGWFQFKHLACVGYGLMFPVAAILLYTFVGATPAYRCYVNECDTENATYLAPWMDNATIANLNNPSSAKNWRCNYMDFNTITNGTAPQCIANGIASGTYNATTPCNKWVFDDSKFTSTIVTTYNLTCGEAWKVTFGSVITMVGVLVGAFFLGPLPDLIGRRKSILILGLWMGGFGIGSCFSPTYEGFAALRFLTGMGGVAVIQALVIWGMEAMGPTFRVKFICIVYCCQSIGNLISGLLAYLIRDWVPLQLVIFITLTTMVVAYFILPESPRWLTVKKRYDEAKEIYLQAAKLNKKTIPDELLDIPMEDDAKAAESGNNNSNLHDSNPLRSALKVLSTPCLLIRLLILCGTWLAQLLCYYGLSYAASNISPDVHLNYILVIFVEIPAYLIGMIAMDYLGRRFILNVTLIFGGAFCLIAGLVPKEQTEVVIAFSLAGKFCTSMLTVANNTFTFELFPTISRGITIALCSTVGKFGSILAPLIADLGKTNRSLPYVIFGAISLGVGVATLTLPETKGLPAPSTIQEALDLEKTKINLRRAWHSFTASVSRLYSRKSDTKQCSSSTARNSGDTNRL